MAVTDVCGGVSRGAGETGNVCCCLDDDLDLQASSVDTPGDLDL